MKATTIDDFKLDAQTAPKAELMLRRALDRMLAKEGVLKRHLEWRFPNTLDPRLAHLPWPCVQFYAHIHLALPPTIFGIPVVFWPGFSEPRLANVFWECSGIGREQHTVMVEPWSSSTEVVAG